MRDSHFYFDNYTKFDALIPTLDVEFRRIHCNTLKEKDLFKLSSRKSDQFAPYFQPPDPTPPAPKIQPRTLMTSPQKPLTISPSPHPAAVCPLPHWLPDAVLQAIAEENNLSETAFFVETADGYHLRWFTPVAEVDLCGHATRRACRRRLHRRVQ